MSWGTGAMTSPPQQGGGNSVRTSQQWGGPQQNNNNWTQGPPPPQQQQSAAWQAPPPQNSWQVAPPPQQQQQQGNWTNNNNNQQSGPQQQQWNNQQNPNGQQGWQQQQGPCGCCSDQQQQQQPNQSMCPCCPQNPEEHCCSTDPEPKHNEMPSACQACWRMCDFTTWFILFFSFILLVAFILVLAINKPDKLLAIYGVTTSAQLDAAMVNDIKDFAAVEGASNGTEPYVTANAMCNTICRGRSSTSPLLPAKAVKCTVGPSSLVGTWGSLCIEDSLSATAMLMNLSRWVNFRATLYFIAVFGTIMLFVLVIAINKQIHPAPSWQDQQNGPVISPPWTFYTTNFYYAFRLTWGTLSAIFFLWFCNEMYSYWWFIDYYCDRTSGELNKFWNDFDAKYMWTMCPIFIFLCWPLCHVVLELVWFIIGILPWIAVRTCMHPQVQNPRTPEILQDNQSCCMRSEMFFCECNQAKRCGFSEGQWLLLTGTRTPFFTCCDMMGGPGQQPQQPPVGHGASQHATGGPPPLNNTMAPQNGDRGFPSQGGPTVTSSQNFQHSQQSHSNFGGPNAGMVTQSQQSFGEVETEASVTKKKKKKKKTESSVSGFDSEMETGDSTVKKKKKKKKKSDGNDD